MSLKTLGRSKALYLYQRRVYYTHRGVEYYWGASVRGDTIDEADHVLLAKFEQQHGDECRVTRITNG